jgi:hypothetical protein
MVGTIEQGLEGVGQMPLKPKPTEKKALVAKSDCAFSVCLSFKYPPLLQRFRVITHIVLGCGSCILGELEKAKANAVAGDKAWKKHGAIMKTCLDDSEDNKYSPRTLINVFNINIVLSECCLLFG